MRRIGLRGVLLTAGFAANLAAWAGIGRLVQMAVG